MRSSIPIFLSLFAITTLSPSPSRADEAADKKAELQKKKEEAKKKAEDRAFERKTTADKAAADKAAADKAAADKAAAEKAAADKAAAEKAAADKAAADKAAADKGAGGKTGAGGASATGGAAATSAGGKATGGASSKVEEKEAPLPVGDIAALRKDRGERRKASVERARKRWGESLLSDPKGSTDLKNHSRRVAYLQRARIVADAKKDKKSVELVDLLLTEEDQRHSNAMNALREGALSVGTNK